MPKLIFASTTDGTILGTEHYAWGENVGWINFGATDGNIHITDTSLSGYMWDSIYGWVNLNPGLDGVVNDGQGNLSGYAWSAQAGFINFVGVVINSSGKFTGQATGGTIYGRINFDCTDCNVVTDWRPTTITPPSTGGGGGGNPIYIPVVNPLTNIITPSLTNTDPSIVQNQQLPVVIPINIPSVNQPITNKITNNPPSRIPAIGIPPSLGQKSNVSQTRINNFSENITKLYNNFVSAIKNLFRTILESTFVKSINIFWQNLSSWTIGLFKRI